MSQQGPTSGVGTERHRHVRRVLWIVLGLNLAVAGAKLLVGYGIGALSLVADGLHSVLDGSSNVVGLVGLSIAARPPDRRHPYGYGRFETLAALGIGLLIGAGFLNLAQQLFSAVMGKTSPPDVSWGAAAVVMFTLVVNLVVSRMEAHYGRKLQSSILQADAQHTMSDAAASLVVLVGFAAVALGWGWADTVAAAAVSVFVGHTAWSVLRSNIRVLADEVQLEPEGVHGIVIQIDGVHGAHNVRSRGAPDAVHLDLHIQVDPALSVGDAHQKTHEVIEALKAHYPNLQDVIIHTEPADGREKDRSRLAPGVPQKG